MLEHILKRWQEWEHLGAKSSTDGSRIVAHTPRDYPEAYLHRFFAPLPRSSWKSYGLQLPGQLQRLYLECNGLSLFAGSLAIYGIRAHYKRDESAQFQPFDLLQHHSECTRVHHHKFPSVDTEPIFFGSYDDGSHLYTTPYEPHIYRVLRHGKENANSWPDIETFLNTEYDRLDRLFSRDGYLLDENTPTTPPL